MPDKPVMDDSIFAATPKAEATEAAAPPSQASAHPPARKPAERGTLNLTVTPDERWEIKEWSTRHRMKIVDVMREGFALMKQKYGE